MSVDKIAPLPPVTTDAQALRVNNRVPAETLAPFPVPPAPAPGPEAPEGALHLFDSLVLPLPDPRTDDSRPLQTTLAKATYAQEASRAAIATLVGGRLPEDAVLREVETLLRNAAEMRAVSVRQVIEAAPKAPLDQLPSQNPPHAAFAFKGRVPAYDAAGEVRLFDLYLARIGADRWEAAVFLRDPNADAPSFPYPAPPIESYRLLIDPGAGLVLASVMEQLVPRPAVRSSAAPILSPAALRTLAITVGLAGVASLLGALFSWRVAAFFAAGAFGFLARDAIEQRRR
jgi:hypothetical protein